MQSFNPWYTENEMISFNKKLMFKSLYGKVHIIACLSAMATIVLVF